MQIEVSDKIILREWRNSDEKRIVALANNEKIARNMRDVFPHPYFEKNARQWIKQCQEEKRNLLLAIEFEGELVGGIGAHFQEDIYRYSAELGYWIGEAYWGKGIVTKAIGIFSDYLFSHYKINRLFGEVFSSNPASGMVLLKNGFKNEAILEKAAFKNGFFIDILIYSKLK